MKKLLIAVTFIVFSACATTSTTPAMPSPAATASVPRNLTVALFPYIPDAGKNNFQGLIKGLTAMFEKQHPDINVTITMSGDPYDDTSWPTLFSQSGPSAVEMDMLTLGDLVRANYVAPLSWQEPVFSFAKMASVVNGTQYAIPTWVCMTFFYAKNPNAPQPPQGTMSGDWAGSWMLPSYYLVAYTDTYGYVPLGNVLTSPPDSTVVNAMATVMAHCSENNANNCLNGVFHNGAPGMPQAQYVQGQYDATTGFSETSYYIFANGGSLPQTVAPMLVTANGKNLPLAFTDGLVANKASCQAQCVADVQTFAQFLNSPGTRTYICFSQDAPAGAPPRRLSPASASFYEQAIVKNDPLYPVFYNAFSGAQGYPNQGFVTARQNLKSSLCKMLKPAIQDACGK